MKCTILKETFYYFRELLFALCTSKVYIVFYGAAENIFCCYVSKKTTGANLLKIWRRAVCTMDLDILLVENNT